MGYVYEQERHYLEDRDHGNIPAIYGRAFRTPVRSWLQYLQLYF